jgi:two-component system, OmpR family, response regulator
MTRLTSVLVIDDNVHDLEFITLAFQAHGGVDVTGEMKPVTALNRIRAEKPDLVVLDIKMPDLDGFTVLAMLREEGNPVPVVMCTGSALQKDVDRAYAKGCNGYVEKPSTLADYRAMANTIVDYWRKGELPTY